MFGIIKFWKFLLEILSPFKLIFYRNIFNPIVIRDQFQLDYFWRLMLKYLAGSADIFIIPLIAILMDPRIREGVGTMFTAKKRGILSKQNSVYSEYM